MIASGRSVSVGERRWARSGLASVHKDCRGARDDVAGVAVLRSTLLFLGTLDEALFGLGEGGSDAAVAFRVGDVTLKRIVAENEVSGREKLAGVGILRIRVGRSLEIAVGSDVIAGAVCGIAGSGQGGGVRGIETEDFFVLREFGGVVVRLGEKLCSLEMGSGSGRQGGSEGHEFRCGFVRRALLEQELDQFDAGFAAVGFGVRVPDSIHSVVVVARGIFEGAAVGGDAGQSEIDGGVLRSALPESDEVGFGFVQAAGIVAVAQGTGQTELVLRVCGIASESGAERVDGVVVAVGAGFGEAFGIELAPSRLLVGGKAGDQMADGGESRGGGQSENQKDDGRRARDQFGEAPRHISYHDIISQS